MAFSKQPAVDTHQTKRIPITTGNTLTANIESPAAYKGQRFINCYPKRVKQDNADDQWVVTKTPSITSTSVTFTSSGTDLITCLSSDQKYFWKGHRLYLVAGGAAEFTAASPDYSFFTMFEAINTASTEILYAGYMVDDIFPKAFQFNDSTNALTLSSTLSFLPVTDEEYQSVFYNGRLYAIGLDKKRIYNSSPGAYTTWTSTDYIVPETLGDDTKAIVVYKNYIGAFGTRSVEWFYDSAVTIGSPLSRQTSLSLDLGIKSSRNIVSVGDNLFFIGWKNLASPAIYMLDGFSPVKISDLYVDNLLSNTDTISSLDNTNLEVIDIAGDLCVGFPVNGTYTSTTWMLLSLKSKSWFSMTLPSASASFPQYPIFMTYSGATSYITTYGTDTVTFHTITKDYASATSSTAEVVFDVTDFGSQYQKHIKSLDVIGDFGNNTVELAWTPYQDYTNWSSFISVTPSTIGHNNTVRYDNLGRFVNFAPRLRIAGTNNMVLKGLEVKYNLGAW